MHGALENILHLAEEGKAEHVSLAEMMRRNEREFGVSVDQQMDDLEAKLSLSAKKTQCQSGGDRSWDRLRRSTVSSFLLLHFLSAAVNHDLH